MTVLLTDKATPEFEYAEDTTPQITYLLIDEDGNQITSALTTQTCTIENEADGVNVVADQDIKETNGNVNTAGSVVWDLPAAFTAKTGTEEFEDHIIAIKFTYGSGRVGEAWIRTRVRKRPV